MGNSALKVPNVLVLGLSPLVVSALRLNLGFSGRVGILFPQAISEGRRRELESNRRSLDLGRGTVVRVYQAATGVLQPSQNSGRASLPTSTLAREPE
jgi:hypothetical protein